jgi:hypothetical protein
MLEDRPWVEVARFAAIIVTAPDTAFSLDGGTSSSVLLRVVAVIAITLDTNINIARCIESKRRS